MAVKRCHNEDYAFIMGSTIVIGRIPYFMIIILSNSFVTGNLKTKPTDTSETLSKGRSYTEDMQKYVVIYLGNY